MTRRGRWRPELIGLKGYRGGPEDRSATPAGSRPSAARATTGARCSGPSTSTTWRRCAATTPPSRTRRRSQAAGLGRTALCRSQRMARPTSAAAAWVDEREYPRIADRRWPELETIARIYRLETPPRPLWEPSGPPVGARAALCRLLLITGPAGERKAGELGAGVDRNGDLRSRRLFSTT